MTSSSFAKRAPQRPARGFSLVEILIVIGVIGTLAIAAFIVYPRVVNAREGNRQADNLRAMHASISTALHGKTMFGVSLPALVSAEIIEPEDIVSPWGTMQLHPTVDGHGCTSAPGCNGYSISYRDVPSEACVSLVQSIAENAHKIRVQGASNHILKGSPPAGSPAGTPHVIYNPSDVPGACNDGDPVIVYVDMALF